MALEFIESEAAPKRQGLQFIEPVTKDELEAARTQERYKAGLASPPPVEESVAVSKNLLTGAGKGAVGAIDSIGSIIKTMLLGGKSDLTKSNIRRGMEVFFPDTLQQFEEASLGGILGDAGVTLPEIKGTPARRRGRVIGEELGAGMVAGAGVVGAAGKAGHAARSVIPGAEKSVSPIPILKEAAETPNKFLGADIVASAGAGAGRAAVEETLGENQILQLLGEMGGAATPFAFARTMENVFRQFNRSKIKAAEFVQKQVRDPVAAAKALDESTKVQGLTTGQQSGDLGLLALERGLTRSGADSQSQFLEQGLVARDSIIKGLEDALEPKATLGPVVAQEFMQGRIDAVTGLLDGLVEKSTKAIDERLRNLGPALTRENAQVITKNGLEVLRETAHRQRAELWSGVPRHLKVDSLVSAAAFKKGFPKTRFLPKTIAILPDDVRALFKGTRTSPVSGKQIKRASTSIGDLQLMRSDLLEDARKATVDSDFKKQRVYHQAADVLLELMHSKEGVSGPLDAALAFSRVFAERFHEGAVGDILGYSKGAKPSDATVALEGIFNATASAGPRADQLRAAQAPIDVRGVEKQPYPETFVEQGTEQFILRRFDDEVVGKKPTAQRIKDWRTNNQALLRRFPELDKRIQNLQRDKIEAEDLVNKRTGHLNTVKQAQKGRFETFLGADPTNAISVALGGTSPVKFTKFLINAARKDKTGGAMMGLRRGMIDDLTRRLKKGGGAPTLQKWDSYMKGSVEGAFAEVFTNAQMKQILMIRNGIKKLDRSKQQLPGSATIENQSIMLEMLSKIAAAKVGRATGTGTIQVPGMFIRQASRLTHLWMNPNKMYRLIEESIFNPELAKDLLKTSTNKKTRGILENRIQGHLANIGEDE